MTDTTEATATTTETTTEATETVETAAGTAPERAARKVREGTVVSNAMDKTAVVAVVDRVRHAKYNKFILRTKKLYAHDETNDVNVGDKVRVMETRPLSKNKRWRITDVLERAK
jgi:small subunit ribosomal protein S17